MAYNRRNRIKSYMLVAEIVKAHYEEGVTTYRGIWRKYVNPVYPMSYSQFMKIVNMPNLQRELKEAGGVSGGEPEDPRQLKLFEEEKREGK